MINRTKIWDQIEKLYGIDASGKMQSVEVITTGSHALDEALGVWGLPKGRVIQYAGKESSGKTLMSLVAIREWQKLDPENWAVFIDAEYTYDKDWASKIGVDNERVFLIKENNGAKIWAMLCGIPPKDSKSKGKPGLLELESKEPSGLGIIVLDSIAAIQAPTEAIKAVGNTNMAPMARFVPDALRRLTPLLGRTGVVFIAINQVRIDIGKMFGDPTSTPGGKAWKHGCSVMIHFTASEKKENNFFDETGRRYGHIGAAKIDKNKVAFPGSKCNFEVEYGHGVVRLHKEVANLGIKFGIVKKPNNVVYTYEGDEQEYSWKGKESFYDGVLSENLSDEILRKVKEARELGAEPVEKVVELEEDEGDVEDLMSDNEEL